MRRICAMLQATLQFGMQKDFERKNIIADLRDGFIKIRNIVFGFPSLKGINIVKLQVFDYNVASSLEAITFCMH